MTLRSRKRLLLSGTFGCLAAAGAVAVWGLEKPSLPEPEHVARRAAARHVDDTRSATQAAPSAVEFQALLAKPLRNPLYDPPPPPPPVVKKPPPKPLQARLLATMIEAGGSMAMLDVGGRVEFRKVGDAISPADDNAHVEKIEAGSIVVSRGDETITLTVEGS